MTDYDDDALSNSRFNPHVLGGCPTCGKEHLTPHGRPACHSHIHGKVDEDGLPVPCKKRPVPPAEDNKLCDKHGGRRSHMVGRARYRGAMRQLSKEMQMLGRELDVTPTETMLTMVREAAGNVAFYRGKVQELVDDVDDQGQHGVVIDDDGVAQVNPAWIGSGVANRQEPGNWKAAPHVLVSMYNDERDRLVRYAKMCRDAGIEEARLAWEMRQGEWLVRTLDGVLERLELTDAQRQELPGIMGQVIAELEAVVDVDSVELPGVGLADDEGPTGRQDE